MGRDPATLTRQDGATGAADLSTTSPAPRPGLADRILNWCRANSLWPLFFGLSCCFVEEATTFTGRYDIARFGSEVFRGSPRQADLLIVSGTVFKKVAPVVLRLYEQMAEPKWVISMGSCANTGGMYDVYSVVQGVDQIIPVDVYVTGCPPRPEALLLGLTTLQERIARRERPLRPLLGMAGGLQGGRHHELVDGESKSRDPRGPGLQGTAVRGSSVTPPRFEDSRSDGMWTPPAPRYEPAAHEHELLQALTQRFGADAVPLAEAVDMPGCSVDAARIPEVLAWLKTEAPTRFARLEDLTAVDESARRAPDPAHGFSLVYTLTSLDAASRFRVTATLPPPGSMATMPAAPSVTSLWPSANWYEREVRDMFGVRFEGHPDPRRLIMPETWPGHPLRKDQPQRATTMAPYTRADARALQPPDAGAMLDEALHGRVGRQDFVLNIGPHHYSTHGLIRFMLELRGEEIMGMDTEIGYHHRGVEKIAERQSWHQFIPYTDRLDYLAGAANNLSYLLAVEKLCGVQVPERAQCVRVMLAELYRISNHLLWFGTFVQDLGMMTPIFHAFREREMIMDIAEAITGARLHPAWLRIGGLAMDLPQGWREMVGEFVRVFPQRLRDYAKMVTGNPIFRARVRGVGRIGLAEAVDRGVSGPSLRACGLAWDLRKAMPYSGYEGYEFEVPTRDAGDCLARYEVRMEEMRESARIVEQCLRHMPAGRYICPDARYALPEKRRTLKDIESLIHHFINVTRGPKVPRGEAYAATESPRGEQGYYVVSDGLNMPYRLHLRSPGYANVQALPRMAVGHALPDFVAILGSLDYILPDIDR